MNPKQFQHNRRRASRCWQATAQRCVLAQTSGAPLISTGAGQRASVIDQLEAIGVAPAAILLEPAARNTAPAIAAAAHWALARGEDDPMLIMPSDHSIPDAAAFQAAVEAALPAALEGNLLTFGVRPARAHTGYGYIQAGEPVSEAVRKSNDSSRSPTRSAPPPSLPTAITSGTAGSSCPPSAFLGELKRYASDVDDQVEQAMRAAMSDAIFVRPGDAFGAVRDISIDYAVMEHSDKVLVVPVTFAWSDVGSWDAVREITPADESGNVLQGDVLALDVTNSLIRSDSDVTVAVIGLDRVVCVVTEDAVFIAPVDRAQDVKKVVEELRARGSDRT